MISKEDNPESSRSTDSRCRFCGKLHGDVRTLVASEESAICDECVLVALESISNRRDCFHLRIAFLSFRFVASVGYGLTSLFYILISPIYLLMRGISGKKSEYSKSGPEGKKGKSAERSVRKDDSDE